MKKALFTLMCLFAVMATGAELRAQEITIDLEPGWNWIANPYPETVDLNTFLSSITPVTGDMIKSRHGFSQYLGTRWRGAITSLTPGMGYMYHSNNPDIVTIVLEAPSAESSVATATPIDITATSAVVGGTVTLPDGGHVFQRGVCWGTEPDPDIDGDHTDEGTGVGSFTIGITDMMPSTTYYVRAYAVTDYGLAYGNEESFTTESGSVDGHGYVDLGLPSGTLWATCNIGANSPEESGDYFAWGETTPKGYYDWEDWEDWGDLWEWGSYQYCNGIFYGESETDGGHPILTKYCNDGLTTLLPEDDAATANWGNSWRMPTCDEWNELCNNTDVTWTTQNGVNGRLFTAENGNSLFLPADAADFYWSSTLMSNDPEWAFGFSCDYGVHFWYRCLGWSVRAVRSGSYTISVSATPSDGGSVSGDGIYEWGQQCTLTATANDGYTFTNWTENGKVVSIYAVYSFTVNGNRTLVANFAFSTDDHTVDLGLPSGTLWATCNIGANIPENYGDYFAWGETQPKDVYDWSTYQYCNGSYNTLTKYCNKSSYGYNGFTDSLTTLLPEDDAATAIWGSGWCMPTADQWRELYRNTTHTWVTQNGVNGQLFTAENGSSLFLPAVGGRWNDDLHDDGSNGYYWSSTLSTGYPRYAWYFDLDSVSTYRSNRYNGFAVRPVRSVSAHAYVDLGLPSGLLWATCNVGADSPEDYGDYFAWGETQPKDTYNWSTYQYANGTSWDDPQFTKYCNNSNYGYNGFTDDLTTLLPEDDAATANWGSDWSMPTKEEWQELYNNTTVTWTTQNGVNGRLFTASNGNSLFLPAAGYRGDGGLYYAGSYDLYWSSSLYTDSPDGAWDFFFYSDNYGMFYYSRSYGFTVRPVCSSRQN